jgi:hypothetical protein
MALQEQIQERAAHREFRDKIDLLSEIIIDLDNAMVDGVPFTSEDRRRINRCEEHLRIISRECADF